MYFVQKFSAIIIYTVPAKEFASQETSPYPGTKVENDEKKPAGKRELRLDVEKKHALCL